jgi:hypothetical protein
MQELKPVAWAKFDGHETITHFEASNDPIDFAPWDAGFLPLYALPDTHRIVSADSLTVDAEIIKALTAALSELVVECMSGSAPSHRALIRARASLPAGVAGSVCK